MTTEETRRVLRDISRNDAELKEAVRSPSNSDQHPQFFQQLLRQYRATVEELCRRDVLLDRTTSAHTLLWNAHNQVNGFCRKGLAKLRKDLAKPVETRKFIKGYLEFLKNSQKWYRAFINVLTKTYGWMPGLEQITGDTSRVAPHASPDAYAHSAFLCYQALISLGDLCRWRAAEKLDKEPIWAHAVGYYDLAAALNPANGAAFHQRAFVEMSQKDHFRAIYYFYRSVMVEDRLPNAIDNLAVEMKSLRKKWGSDELSVKVNLKDNHGKRKALVLWYLRLQSLCFTGEETPGHAELENTVISHLSNVATVPDSVNLLQKVVIAAMAAERTSLIRLEEAQVDASENIITTFNNYHALNIRAATALLRIFEKEARGALAIKARATSPSNQSLEHLITPIMHNVLPVLRLYHHYLLSNYQFVLASDGDIETSAVATQLWSALASAANAAATAFPLGELIEVSYILEEDVDVIAFTPIISDATTAVWHNDDGIAKPRFSDRGTTRVSTRLEMLSRIRDLQVAAVRLSIIQETPIRFEKGQFFLEGDNALTVQAAAQPGFPISSPHKPTQAPQVSDAAVFRTPPQPPRQSATLPRQRDALRAQQATSAVRQIPEQPTALQSPVQLTSARTPAVHGDSEQEDDFDQQDLDASRMVDDLVGPDESPVTSRPVSGLDVRPQQRTPSVPSSFALAPPTARGGSRVERLQNGSLFGQQQGQNFAPGMHSPLMFGNGGLWDPAPNARSKSIGTPPNGQIR
ncbi:Hypothetical protein D9617_40g012770 [Elsinoe fawcettii]|nr:Hypothetical protein D9617_40g012770 [Elsinoe fawcettii]